MAALPPLPHPFLPSAPTECVHAASEGQEASQLSEETTATLLVRHLPEAIPEDMLSRLFSHYGSSSVRPCAGGRLRNCAFVDFKDEALASRAQSQLNRLRFLGKVLTVERMGKANITSTSQQAETKPVTMSTGQSASLLRESLLKSSAFSVEPISGKLRVDYPFPPHLEYAYPPPDGNILNNIVNALIAVPRFYTQVLHLMNKMNIPAPFHMALPTPPLPPTVPAPPSPPPPASENSPSAGVSSDESEMESSEEDAGDVRTKKRAKRVAIVGPAVDKDVAHESVGLKHVPLVPKEVPIIKKKNPVIQIKVAPKLMLAKKVATDGSQQKVMEKQTDELELVGQVHFVTPQEIESGRLPPEEILSLPMFKNYATGNPSAVLYIKNLAKDVIVDDFYLIFGSLFGSVDAAKSNLIIKLMQEGRMRGQAFVTFPSIDLAHRALNLVNGYVYKGKPMIIQFGRSRAIGKTN